MRVSAAILAVILGSSTALAQGDPRANPVPVPEATRAAKTAKPEPKPKSARKEEAAKPKPDADKKGEAAAAKPKSKSATSGSAAPGISKPSGLQDTYAAIPQTDRVAIQNDLTWGGDFTGPIDGEFSERLVQAVKAYQTRHKNPATGVMSPEERKALAAAVEPRKREVGWRLAEDLATGARVG